VYSKVYTRGGTLKLGNHLRRLRFEHNQISQQALANAVGVTRLTIHSIENGKFSPSTLLAMKIARFFDKTVEDVFYIIDEDD
jgi:putative transcriptional regulator